MPHEDRFGQTQQTAQRSSYWKQARQSWREARAERSGASTQLPLAAKQLRIMGNHTSLGTKTVLVTSQLILLINNRTVYDPETWDQTEVKVWDSATRNDKVAVGLLGTWRAVSEALKSPVGPQSETCGLPDCEGAAGSFTAPSATPSAPLLLQPSKAFAVTPMVTWMCLLAQALWP